MRILLFLTLLFSSVVFAEDQVFRIQLDPDDRVTATNPQILNKLKTSYTKSPNGAVTLSTEFISGRSSDSKIKLNLEQIPIIFENEVYGSLTEVVEGKKIYASALHLFRFDLTSLHEDTLEKLSGLTPILVKKNNSEYFDIVLFVESTILNSSNKNQLHGLVKNYLNTSININNELTSDSEWISPQQYGKLDGKTTDQASQGKIQIVVFEDFLNKIFNNFYLADDRSNFSSKGSSGSVIFDSSTASPLGVLQCQMNQDIVDKYGNLYKTKGLYRALSFTTINNNEIEILNSTEELFSKAKQLKVEKECDWRDGKMGGGN